MYVSQRIERKRGADMTYLIDYDLNTPGKNYASLSQAIKSYNTWVKICKFATLHYIENQREPTLN